MYYKPQTEIASLKLTSFYLIYLRFGLAMKKCTYIDVLINFTNNIFANYAFMFVNNCRNGVYSLLRKNEQFALELTFLD